MPNPSWNMSSKQDDHNDFQARLRRGFEELSASLIQLHVSEVGVLLHDNEQLKLQLAQVNKYENGVVLEVAANRKERPVDTQPNNETSVQPRGKWSAAESEKRETSPKRENSAHSRVSKVAVAETIPSESSKPLTSPLTSQQEETPANGNEKDFALGGTVRSAAGAQDGFVSDVSAPMVHFHMKRVWSNLAEDEMEKVTLASFQENPHSDHSQATTVTDVLTRRRTPSRLPLMDYAPQCTCLQRFMMYPNSLPRMTWTCFSLCLLIYDFIMIPYSLSFDMKEAKFDKTMTTISCVFWTGDILVSFFTGIYKDFRLVMDPMVVFLEYAKAWMWFDLFLVTLEWFMYVVESMKEANLISMFRGIRIVRIMRMLRLIRVTRIAKFSTLLNDLLVVTPEALHGCVRFGVMIAVTTTFVHLGACVWAVIGQNDGGWLSANDMDQAPGYRQYAISLHWLLISIQGSRPSPVVVHSTSEIFFDSLLILLSFVLSTFFIATVTVSVLTQAESDTAKIQSMAKRYLKSHDFTASTRIKTHRFLKSQGLNGPGELIAFEQQLFKAFPMRLQEDLHYECRAPKLCRISAFSTLRHMSPPCVRQLCNEIKDRLVGEGELVFSKGDACNHLFMVRSGQFRYKSTETILVDTPRYRVFERNKDPNTDGADILVKGQIVCESTLWTDWENVGDLSAMDGIGLLLVIDADKFAQMVCVYRAGRLHAARYSHHFVFKLNRCRSCDITGFDFTLAELDTPAYSGTPEDHYAFISHYKVESGTEASLMRDLMLSSVKSDPSHEFHEYMSAVFVDSEDLVDLARLQAHVEGSTNIVILLTPGLLSRPWCLLEFVTAVRSGVNIVPVEIQRPGIKYIYPDEDWYVGFRKGEVISKESSTMLLGMGVAMDEIEDAIRHIFLKIALPFSPHKSGNVRNAEIEDIMKRCSSRKPFDSRAPSFRSSRASSLHSS